MDYWKPRTRTELNKWLEKQYPGDSFRRKTEAQCWAVFYRTIDKHRKGEVKC